MLGLILLAGFATLSVAQFRAIRRFARLRQDLGQAVAEAQKRHEEMATQNALDENVNLLRLSLLALGPPKLAPDGLYFGNRKINGDHTIVDEVRQKFGGAATIFMGDERIATNVESPGGGRAIGTRLAAGPVHDQVFGKKISYRGETNILGEPYVAIYEPIIADGAVIGLIFAGSKKSTAAPPPPLEINAYVALISSITRAQAEAATQAITLRQHADDQRRMLEADRQTLARQQEVALNQLALALRALATGDLTAVLTSKFSGGYESLRNDFNTAITKLQDTLRIVIENSQSVRAGTNDITQGLDDLSGRTEQLAASLEQSSAALAQLNVTVSETAAGASEAQGFVSQTSADALHSIEVLRETVTAMSNIQTSSNQIAGIIGVMDELSFQTNLLALNAGVEAARAGDAGRGFAVVATEVRALAQRSTDAAKEIKNLITVSRDQVTTGVRLVAETTTLLERISTQVQQLDARIKRFANATSDQSMGLQQITEAVNAMDKATQQNAASAEESTAASHQIAAEASALADQMEHFRLTPTPPHQVRTQNAGTRAKNPVFHTV